MGHLTNEQRYTIGLLLSKSYSQSSIAQLIGKCKSVISREIRRNCKPNGKYCAKYAQRAAMRKRYLKRKNSKCSPQIVEFIKSKLRCYWSPEQISAVGKREMEGMVSTETIYHYIKKDKRQGGKLYKYLRRSRKYKRLKEYDRNKKQIRDRTNISQRPKQANDRTRIGDLEVDLVLGKLNSGAIVSINDRKTGYVKLKYVKTKRSPEVMKAIIKALRPMKNKLYTLTSDNGREFTQHKTIAKILNIDYYFCDPYASWQRGSNENLNGLIRQFYPKGSSFETLTNRKLKIVENLLNNRPRKRLNFRSPKDLFFFKP